MLYTYVFTAIVSGAIAFSGAWTVQNWRLGEQVQAIEAKHAKALAEANQKAIDDLERWSTQKDKALKNAQANAKKNKDAAAAAAAESDRLRGDLATAEQIAQATRSSLEKHTQALTEVFNQCVRRYIWVAEKADGHETDTTALEESWPQNPKNAR